ncbi:c-type cytochrome, partial [Streptococcus pyogenes]
ERLRPAELARTLKDGRPATQMPGFASALSADALTALAAWLRTAPAQAPTWSEADMRATHRQFVQPDTSDAVRPRFKA